jgi:hypothetical protein
VAVPEVAHPQIHTTMPTMEVKVRKAFIGVGISLAEKSIATPGQAEGEQKKAKAPRREGPLASSIG